MVANVTRTSACPEATAGSVTDLTSIALPAPWKSVTSA